MTMRRPQGARDVYFETLDKLIKQYPVMLLPKADGNRSMFEHHEGAAYAKPGSGKPLTKHIHHIQKWTHCAIHPKDEVPFTLDGELYLPGETINEVNSAVKGAESEWLPSLEYHLFDIMVPDMSFRSRRLALEHWYAGLTSETISKVKLLPCVTVHSKEELLEWNEKWLAEGWEGTIIRDPEAVYVFGSKTNKGCLRLKPWIDSEYLCIDITDGKGKNVGIAKFICQCTKTGETFGAAPLGDTAKRKAYFTNREEIIGKMVTVKYQNLTTRGVPRFGTMKCVRDWNECNE